MLKLGNGDIVRLLPEVYQPKLNNWRNTEYKLKYALSPDEFSKLAASQIEAVSIKLDDVAIFMPKDSKAKGFIESVFCVIK